MANSSMLALPRITAPSRRSRATTVASKGGTKFSRILEAQVVLSPLVTMTSFRARGMPVRGVASPRARRASASRAWARAPAASTVR